MEALKMEPKNYNALIGLGKAYEKKSEYELAIDYTQQATELNTNINAVYYLVMKNFLCKNLKNLK